MNANAPSGETGASDDAASRRKRPGVILAVTSLTVTAATLGRSGVFPHRGGSTPLFHGRIVVDPQPSGWNRPATVTLATLTYGRGQSSGWHSHPGMHLVSIESGTLTVYGPECRPTTFPPGQSYMGGESVRLARNETDSPVEMAVTHQLQPGRSMRDIRVAEPAPPGCAVP